MSVGLAPVGGPLVGAIEGLDGTLGQQPLEVAQQDDVILNSATL